MQGLTDYARINVDLQNIAANLISRINSGHTTLGQVEERMFDLALDKNNTISLSQLLDIAKYLRYSINSETKMVLDVVKPFGKKNANMPESDLIQALKSLPVEERERVTDSIQA